MAHPPKPTSPMQADKAKEPDVEPDAEPDKEVEALPAKEGELKAPKGAKPVHEA